MKRKYKFLLSAIISLFVISVGSNIVISENKLIKIKECDDSEYIPKNYREIKELNISGSSQFTPKQLPSLIRRINTEGILDIDIRQESHGYINNLAFNYTGNGDALNYGLDSNEVLAKELDQLSKIEKNSEVTIQEKEKNEFQKVIVQKVFSEYELASNNNVEYIRLAVKDGDIPSVDVIDNFINIVKNKPENLHIHFHCGDGKDRTTTFMAMYRIMNNISNFSLNEILSEQINIGGTDLKKKNEVLTFLTKFYNYVEENKDKNYDVAYSNWIEKK